MAPQRAIRSQRGTATAYAPAVMDRDRLFEVHRTRRNGAVVVIASGEIDLASSPELRAALYDPETQGETVMLDLREVTFMDSSGLGVIVGQHKRAREEGFRFCVAVDGAPEVLRILELSGLVSVLDIAEASDSLLTE
jgi:anti-sigma B factor antagonist